MCPSVEWAAGFIEGEGCVSPQITRTGGKTYTYKRITAVQTDRVPLDALCTMFGGSVHERTRRGSIGKKRCWVWSVSGHRAESAWLQLKPHFVGQTKVNSW